MPDKTGTIGNTQGVNDSNKPKPKKLKIIITQFLEAKRLANLSVWAGVSRFFGDSMANSSILTSVKAKLLSIVNLMVLVCGG